jgi:hypothetical protein
MTKAIAMNIEHRTSNAQPRMRGRRAVLCLLGLLSATLFPGALNSNAQTNPDNGPTFDSFQIITHNNIFDPNRSPGFVYNTNRTHVNLHPVDAFALVGTMSYAKGKFAFFDGSSSQYKKVLEPGADIAGYTVKEITPQAVTLAANGKEFEMKVGTQLRKESNNQWRLTAYADFPTNPGETGESATVPSATPPTGSSPEMSDVLKRLMLQRQQELK